MESKLTVYFEDPFWVGVFERTDGGKLSVCKVTFGAEPTDAEIYAFVLSCGDRLKFSSPIKTQQKQKADNLKRRQRAARKQLEHTGVGTKSQQALQQQYELMKTERKQQSREEKEAQKQSELHPVKRTEK
ncbi:MAG: YjdF family protein [Ruminococcus sp.]|nr:YjdF family protein [Ruminococcus sp.]